MQPDPGPWYPMEVAWAVPCRVTEGHRRVQVDMASVHMGSNMRGSGFVPGELVRLSRGAKRSAGGDCAVMWSLAGEPGVRENVGIFTVPWDSVGLALGERVIHPTDDDVGPSLLGVLFPHGVGYWWPERFEGIPCSR